MRAKVFWAKIGQFGALKDTDGLKELLKGYPLSERHYYKRPFGENIYFKITAGITEDVLQKYCPDLRFFSSFTRPQTVRIEMEEIPEEKILGEAVRPDFLFKHSALTGIYDYGNGLIFETRLDKNRLIFTVEQTEDKIELNQVGKKHRIVIDKTKLYKKGNYTYDELCVRLYKTVRSDFKERALRKASDLMEL